MSRFNSLFEAVGKKKSKREIERMSDKLRGMGFDNSEVDRFVQAVADNNTCRHQFKNIGLKKFYHQTTGAELPPKMEQCCQKCNKTRFVKVTNEAVTVWSLKEPNNKFQKGGKKDWRIAYYAKDDTDAKRWIDKDKKSSPSARNRKYRIGDKEVK